MCLVDLQWVSKVRVNTQAVLKRAQHIQGHKLPKKQWQVENQADLNPNPKHRPDLNADPELILTLTLVWTQTLTKSTTLILDLSSLVPQAAWLLKAITCIDLTTLAGDDTPSNVHRLCLKAVQPVRRDLLKSMDMHDKGQSQVDVMLCAFFPPNTCDHISVVPIRCCVQL